MLNEKEINNIADAWEAMLSSAVVFLPIIGPVYAPDKAFKKILLELLGNAESDKFLSYDKNKRWYKKKPEKILVNHIHVNGNKAIIPTSDKNFINIFHQSLKPAGGSDIQETREMATRIAKKNDVGNLFIHFNHAPKSQDNFRCFKIFLKKISSEDIIKKNFDNIKLFDELDISIKKSFARLGEEPEMEGFGALWNNYLSKKLLQLPIICAIDNGSIIGAIGPIEIMEDCWGSKFLAPPYFGVVSSHRRQGIGHKLWNSALDMAARLGAKYTLVQNQPGSPAANFYLGEGLVDSGERYTLKI